MGHCVGLQGGGKWRDFGTGLATNRKNRVVAKRRFNGDQPSPSYRSNWLTETIGRSDGRHHPVLGWSRPTIQPNRLSVRPEPGLTPACPCSHYVLTKKFVKRHR